jgi:uncharacterized damage-inducible protein DinB
MHKELLGEMVAQNRLSCSFAFSRITDDNACWRACPAAASIGFVYRHIGETMHLFGQFFGIPTEVQNTTMGNEDTGRDFDVGESRRLVEQGYGMLERLVEDTPDPTWHDIVETPFFGSVSRARLFAHVLYHTAYHAGQIGLTLARGQAPADEAGTRCGCHKPEESRRQR